MHELSIAHSLVDLVLDQLAEMDEPSVDSLVIRVGVMSGVDPVALRSAFPAASVGTPLFGAKLEIEAGPVVVWCESCAGERTLGGIGRLLCPQCGERCPDVRRGRELELVRVILHEHNDPASTAAHP